MHFWPLFMLKRHRIDTYQVKARIMKGFTQGSNPAISTKFCF